MPPLLPRPIRLQQCRQCLHKPLSPRPSLLQTRSFHPSRRKHQEAIFPDHYATLSLTSSATPAEIKKQFYTLSKKYHPDLNASNPSASEKFVKISEAYHTLGSTTNRQKYDRDYQRVHHKPEPIRTGSYSSSSNPVGARPASGLSRRRTQFRGPPPSFYAQGGYGDTGHGGARERATQEQAFRAQQDPQRASGLGSTPEYPGSGGYEEYREPELPYFDKASHRRTHDNLGSRREGKQAGYVYPSEYTLGGGLWFNFFLVTGVVGIATVAATFLVNGVKTVGNGGGNNSRKKRENG